MAQWALAWCLKNPLVSAVIPGCKDAAQVRANAEAAGLVNTSAPTLQKVR
jgi:aryl-alcohol dehydrogenase-like predicted oxidoreductase